MNGINKRSNDHSCWVLTMCVWDTHIDAHSCQYHIRLFKVRNSNFKKDYLFLAVLGLHCYTQAFSSCDRCGLLSSRGAWAAHCCGFSRCRAWPLELRFQWLWFPGLDALQHVESSLKRGGIHILVLAGRFLTTGPPGKSRDCNFKGVLLDPDSDKSTKTWLQLWL